MAGIDMIQMNSTARSKTAADKALRKDDSNDEFSGMLKKKELKAKEKDSREPVQDKHSPSEKTEAVKPGTDQAAGEMPNGIHKEEQEMSQAQLDLLLAAAMLNIQVGMPEQPVEAPANLELPAGTKAAEPDPSAEMSEILFQQPDCAGIPVQERAEQLAASQPQQFTEVPETAPAVSLAQAEPKPKESAQGDNKVPSAIRSVEEDLQEIKPEISGTGRTEQERNASAGEKKDTGNSGESNRDNRMFHVAGNVENRQVAFKPAAHTQPSAETVRTTPDTLPEDVGKALAARLPGKDGTLTIELEPVSLGKLTIKVVYDEGKAAVSILSSNPKTLELLSRNASEIAGILEEKTGQETVIYTQQPEQQQAYDEGQNDGRRQERERQEEKKEQPSDSFAQQLRLGLV